MSANIYIYIFKLINYFLINKNSPIIHVGPTYMLATTHGGEIYT